MNEWEQFEALIEKRVIERRASRVEVYALRRLRRAPGPRTRGALLAAYFEAVFARPINRAMTQFARSAESAAKTFNEYAMRWNQVELESADLGEFDNRAHDWIADDGDAHSQERSDA